MVNKREEDERQGPTQMGERPVKRAVQWGALLLLASGAAFLGMAFGSFIYRAANAPVTPEPEIIEVRSTPDVVMAIRDLARLESTSFHMERVIELTSTQRHLFGLVEAEDTILLVAAADVVAGVDLSALEPGDVTIDERTHSATLVLPAPVVLHTALDGEHTYVHSRSTDVLARRREDLETRARREAERSLEASAIEAGILERARQSTQRTVESLVRSLGYHDVTVTFRD